MNLLNAAAVGVCGFVACTAVAQAGTLEVNVPFSFVVGAQKMPAGAYRIEREPGSANVVSIRGTHGHTAQLFLHTVPLTDANPASGTPSLVFVPDETQKRLTAIWESDIIGHEVSTRREAVRLFGRTDVAVRPRT